MPNESNFFPGLDRTIDQDYDQPAFILSEKNNIIVAIKEKAKAEFDISCFIAPQVPRHPTTSIPPHPRPTGTFSPCQGK